MASPYVKQAAHVICQGRIIARISIRGQDACTRSIELGGVTYEVERTHMKNKLLQIWVRGPVRR